MYEGQGLLYFVGTPTLKYKGRFKKGKMHGRGIEFNIKGEKEYQGNFKEGMREGKGEEYAEGVMTYKGGRKRSLSLFCHVTL